MSAAFIGCKISLISKSEIRYEGILYTIDTKESTIALAKVRSYGTEDRVTDKPVAPRNEVYEYIIFRASDIKDLIVDDPPSAAPAPGLTDPAIIQAQSVGGSSSAPAFNSPTFSAAPGSNIPSKSSGLSSVLTGGLESRSSTPRNKSPASSSHQDEGRVVKVQSGTQRTGQQQPRQQRTYQGNNYRQQNRDGDSQPRYQQRQGGNQRQQQQSNDRGINQERRGQWVQRDQRDNNRYQNSGGNGNNGRQQQPNRNSRQPGRPNRPMPVAPTVTQLEEFDFEKANAEFVELTSKVSDLKVGDGETNQKPEKNEDEDVAETYNKTKSFFDSISCEAIEKSKGNTNRVDRREERKLNQETFGVSGIRRGRGWGNRGYNNRNNNYNRGGDRRAFDGEQQPQQRRGGYRGGFNNGRPRPAARAGGEAWRGGDQKSENN